MSEHEFEAYLNLLARTLRLSDKQRNRIAGELRDHMEQRLDELTAAGMTRHDAALRALDEFGDANVLAHELSDSARLKSRRRLMQTTFATASLAAVVALGVMYLAPANFQGQPSQPVANAQNADNPQEKPAPSDPASDFINVDFKDTSLKKALDTFAHQLGVNFHVDWATLELDGIERDQPVTMNLLRVAPDAAFDLLLRTTSNGGRTMAYEVIDDRLWLITSPNKVRREIISLGYDLTDLTDLRRSVVRSEGRSSGRGGYGMGGEFGGTRGGMGMGAMGMEDVFDGNGELHAVLEDALPANAWNTPGAGLILYDGMAIVRQTPANHDKISETLDMLTDMLERRAAVLEAQAEARLQQLHEREQEAKAKSFAEQTAVLKKVHQAKLITLEEQLSQLDGKLQSFEGQRRDVEDANVGEELKQVQLNVLNAQQRDTELQSQHLKAKMKAMQDKIEELEQIAASR